MKPQHILVIKQETLVISKEPAHVKSYCPEISDGSKIMLVQREMAETDPTYRQIIPYVMARDEENNILAYRRLKGVGESRLAGKISIGVGGHIDGPDLCYHESGRIDVEKTIESAAVREIEEEFDLPIQNAHLNTIGYLFDNSDLVGQVHMGVLMIMDVEGVVPPVESREADLQVMGWINKIESPEDFENWSLAAGKSMGIV